MDTEPNQTTTDDIEDNLAERISNTSQHSDENGNLDNVVVRTSVKWFYSL